MKEKLKVSVFGCGKMGMHHVNAIKMIKGAELSAVADPQADREKITALLPKGALFFSDAEELLKTVKPNVVHIVTPPTTHHSLAELAMKYGANVYVEKPFTLETKEAESLLSKAGDLGLKVCAGHQLLFEPPGRKLSERIGKIGKIIHIESYFSFRTVRKTFDGKTPITPRTQLMDILPHPVYSLLNILHTASNNEESSDVRLLSLDVDALGDVNAIVKQGDTTGHLTVTLRGRPIESYLRVVGTHGSLFADFVRGTVIDLAGQGGGAISIILNPYREAKQLIIGTTIGFASRALSRNKGYPGLPELAEEFYKSIANGGSAPIPGESIIETVRICESISNELERAEKEYNTKIEKSFRYKESTLSSITSGRGRVLVTGGTGFLGSNLAVELRGNGWPVTIITRRIPSFSTRIPGVDYLVADLGEEIPEKYLQNVDAVVHCAAETAGGKEEHERNSIRATRNIVEAAGKAGVKKLINISSVAVMKTSREMGAPLDESTPLDLGNLGRGPYVWGKAESEHLAIELGKEKNIDIRTIRLGPLVDFNAFEAPGRLGREAGPYFIAMGSKKSQLSVCDVHTAAKAIKSYLSDYDSAPPLLNLIEPDAPTRAKLASIIVSGRPDLKIIWVPGFVLTIISPILKGLQLVIRRGKKPIDIKSAFASEKYNSDLAARVIEKAI